jgi:hypothetical protein
METKMRRDAQAGPVSHVVVGLEKRLLEVITSEWNTKWGGNLFIRACFVLL